MSFQRMIQAGLAAVAMGATVLFGASGAAQAAGNDNFKVTSSDKFVLVPQANGGYFGEITVSVTYVGTNPDGVLGGNITINPPKGYNFKWSDEQIQACVTWLPSECSLHNSGGFKPGVPRTVKIGFESYAAPKSFARIARDGWVTVTANNATPGPKATTNFSGIMAASSGSTYFPVTYRPHDYYDTALTGGPTSLTKNADGSWTASTEMNWINRSNIVNLGGDLRYSLPGGAEYPTEPRVMCMSGWCELPNDYAPLYEGKGGTFRLTWTIPAETAPGTYTGFLRIATKDFIWGEGEPEDRTPADNTVVLSVTIP